MNTTQAGTSAEPIHKTKRQRTGERVKRFTEDRGLERQSLTIDEFCGRHNVSKNSFYRSDPGDRPRVTAIFGMPRITLQDEREWLRRQREKSRPAAEEAD